MRVAVSKWGNSLGLRIPKGIAEDINLLEGMAVDMRVLSGAIIVTPSPDSQDIESIMKGYRSEHRHDYIDWGESVGKEIW